MTVIVADDAAQHGVGGEGYVEFVLRFGTKELVAHADGLPLLMNGDRINRGYDGVSRIGMRSYQGVGTIEHGAVLMPTRAGCQDEE